MQLTEDERAALERLRLVDCGKDECDVYGGMTEHGYRSEGNTFADRKYLANAMLRLFPVRTYGDIVIRWDDPVTPERLVACGFKADDNGTHPGLCYKGVVYQDGFRNPWLHGGVLVVSPFAPRNMGELWSLMERCGIEEGGK